MNPIAEEWTETKYPNYFVNKNGEVKKKLKTSEKMCNPVLGKHGYFTVSIGKSPGKVNIHRLMGETFLPNPTNLRNIDHIDRNKLNNKLENLRWFSQKDNMLNRDGLLNIGKCSDRDMWYARAGNCVIGRFKTEEEAKACKYGFLKAKEITLPQ